MHETKTIKQQTNRWSGDHDSNPVNAVRSEDSRKKGIPKRRGGGTGELPSAVGGRN